MGATEQMLRAIRMEMEANADPANREKMRKNFNVGHNRYRGVKMPVIRKIAGAFYKQVQKEHIDDVLDRCDALLQTGWYEERVVAISWAYRKKKEYEPRHLARFEGWLNEYVEDWSDCDNLSSHVIGEMIRQYPELAPRVLKWTKSKNRWVRRAAAVAYSDIGPKGEWLAQIIPTADALLNDPDDMVQKGYGWMLKEASAVYPTEVFAYVMNRKATMPRTALRYAIEKLPPEQRAQAMKK